MLDYSSGTPAVAGVKGCSSGKVFGVVASVWFQPPILRSSVLRMWGTDHTVAPGRWTRGREGDRVTRRRTLARRGHGALDGVWMARGDRGNNQVHCSPGEVRGPGGQMGL